MGSRMSCGICHGQWRCDLEDDCLVVICKDCLEGLPDVVREAIEERDLLEACLRAGQWPNVRRFDVLKHVVHAISSPGIGPTGMARR